jgi:hypothetical protein
VLSPPDFVLTIDVKKESIKTSTKKWYYLELNQDEVPIYEKADATSRVIATSPQGRV